ncbi:MAG: DUF3471 domain-containing protein [Gemmatimonadaceae bacterium]
MSDLIRSRRRLLVIAALFIGAPGGCVSAQAGDPLAGLDGYISSAITDSLYGTARVTTENGQLALELAPRLVGDLEHWHYDTFNVVWRDHRDGTNLVTFTLDSNGQVELMKTDVGGPTEEQPQMKRAQGAQK